MRVCKYVDDFFVYVSVYLIHYLSIHLSIYIYIYICLSVCLSVCLFIFLYLSSGFTSIYLKVTFINLIFKIRIYDNLLGK